MANRILLFVSASLAAVMLATTSAGAASTADQCLAKPKGPPPAGKHWYYQTNRATKRKCWFLADEGAKVVSAKRRKAAAPEKPAEQDEQTRVQPPIADAHAELISAPQAKPATPATQFPPQTSDTQSPPQTQEMQKADESAPDGANAGEWVLASRWPDASIAYASGRTTMAGDPEPAATVPATQTKDPVPVLAASMVVPVEQPTAAVDARGDTRLAQLAAAFFLVAIAGAAIMLFVGSRRRTIALPTDPARPSIDRRPRF